MGEGGRSEEAYGEIPFILDDTLRLLDEGGDVDHFIPTFSCGKRVFIIEIELLEGTIYPLFYLLSDSENFPFLFEYFIF